MLLSRCQPTAAAASHSGAVSTSAPHISVRRNSNRRGHVLGRAASTQVSEAKAQQQEDGKVEVVGLHEASGVHPTPSSKEVEAFLATLVNETSIAEMHLQVGSFELKVKRNTAPPPPPPPPTVVIAKEAAPQQDALKSVDESQASMDESLVYVPSPKVGIFTRGKYVGGKRVGKGNIANKGDQLKKGQTIGYVEQLGTYVPVEAPQAGEAVHFLVEEGSPVEYGQVIVELAPFFGGHIIGDSKYA